MMSDNQFGYYINEHLDADNLRKDTSRYLRVIKDYKIITEKDSVQSQFLQSSFVNQQNKIQKLTAANTRWKRLAFVQLGLFTVSLGVIYLLTVIK